MADPVTFKSPMLERVDMIKKLPFATSLALNMLAKEIKNNYQDEATSVQQPSPIYSEFMYIKSSSKTNLYAEVGLQEPIKGNASSKYVREWSRSKAANRT